MTEAKASALAPSSKLALYLAAVISIYLIDNPAAGMVAAAVFIAVALVAVRGARGRVPASRWHAAIVFLLWVFLMRAALDLVTGVPVSDPEVWLTAGRQAARVAVLAVGVITLVAIVSAREIVDELEVSRVPRPLRVLVMMLVQYPRVLRQRYDQIVEAQVARGAERPRTVTQRVARGAAILLPVMQSELNAVGERATLLHLRGLDTHIVMRFGVSQLPDRVARLGALVLIAIAIALRATL